MNSFKKIFSLFILQSFLVSVALAAQVIGTVPLSKNENYFVVLKSQPDSLTPSSDNDVLISREQYLISYNRQKRLLNWAEWRIDDSDLGEVTRTNDFSVDKELDTYLKQFGESAVSLQDYKGSCFDRGHQVPSADRTNNEESNSMTFVLSNMVPQTRYLNRVVWRNFENFARRLVTQEGKKVYVIAGPIYDKNFGRIGVHRNIPVPSKNFKVLIVLDKDQNINDVSDSTQIIAVIMPNLLQSGKKPHEDIEELCTGKVTSFTAHPMSNDWHNYQTTLAEVEKQAGFKFFARH